LSHKRHFIASNQFVFLVDIEIFSNRKPIIPVIENDIIVNIIIITKVLTKPTLNIKLVYNSMFKGGQA